MDPRVAKIVQGVSLGMGAWCLLRFLDRVDGRLSVILVAICCLNVATVWLLHFQRSLIGKYFPQPGIKQYVTLVCRTIDEQPPVEHVDHGRQDELCLKTLEEFGIAGFRAKQVVRGHDGLLDDAFCRIREAVILRRRRVDRGSMPPLATFLLAGGQGTGRAYLARVVGKLLYRTGETLIVPCDKADVASTFGANGLAGDIVNAVRKQPYQVLVFDAIDAATAEFLDHLLPIVKFGNYRVGKQDVSFQHTVIFLTCSKGVSSLRALVERSYGDKAWHQKAIEALTSETALNQDLLSAVSDILVGEPLSDVTKAEVIALAMKQEAQAHGVALVSVAPEILATEVGHLNDSTGFATLPERIRKIMHRPLVAAAQQERTSMSLGYSRRVEATMEAHHESSLRSA